MLGVPGDGVPAGAGSVGGVPGNAVPVLPNETMTIADLFAPIYDRMDDAKIRHHAASIAGNADAIFDAEFGAGGAELELASLECDVALRWLLGLRLAVKRYPVETADMIDKVFAVRRQMKRGGV